jgi:uncharacterized alkaline shock family protein YloU
MSDVINSIFGRPNNESTGSGEYAYGAVEPAPAVAEAPVIEEADSAPETEAATETAEAEAVDSDQVEDDSAEEDAEETAGETAEADEDVTGTDEEAVAEDTEEDAAETEPVAEVAEDEPVAEAVETEPVADEAVGAEPIADTEPAVARPAAGSRGSTTVADGVVGKIVTRIASQTEGVHSVAADGIKVELADEVAWVTIPVVLEFGHAVKAVGEQIRVAVIDAVEQYLGLDVEVVDVHVTDIHFPDAD